MTWWLVPLLIFVLLSPLTWLLPSRRQRGQMDVRLAARRQGLSMQLVPQEWPHWMEPLPPDPCPQYALPRRRRAGQSVDVWQPEAGRWVDQWRHAVSDPLLLEHLARLPADVYRLQANSQSVTVFWGERGGEPALVQVAAVLKALA
jgi:hypothetical protein